jgi:hypothetical protein
MHCIGEYDKQNILNFELALFCLQLVVSAYQLTVTGLFV